MEQENDNAIQDKSIKFAIRIVNLYGYLKNLQKEEVLSKQILRSGTSIGANIAESQCASSRKDFLNKVYIAFKECNETLYWLELLKQTNYITQQQFESINVDCMELKKLLSSITKTINSND